MRAKDEVHEIVGGIFYKGKVFENFQKVMDISFTFHKTIIGYSVIDNVMRLYWYDNSDKYYIKLPYEMNSKSAAPFVWNWLQSKWGKFEGLGPEPDTDGSTSPGFELRAGCESIFRYTKNHEPNKYDSSYVAVIIKPVWIIYGK